MELAGFKLAGPFRRRGLTMQRIKVYAVAVTAAVAHELRVYETLLHDISIGMEPEGGIIMIYGISEAPSRHSPTMPSKSSRTYSSPTGRTPNASADPSLPTAYAG